MSATRGARWWLAGAVLVAVIVAVLAMPSWGRPFSAASPAPNHSAAVATPSSTAEPTTRPTPTRVFSASVPVIDAQGLVCGKVGSETYINHEQLLAASGSTVHDETADTPPAAALRAAIAAAAGSVPASGYALLAANTDTERIYVAAVPPAGDEFAVASATLDSGRWAAVFLEDCVMRSVAPEPGAGSGYKIASWWFDPNWPPVASSSVLHIVIYSPVEAYENRAALDIHADGPLVTITAFGGWAVEAMPVFNEIPEIVYLDQPIGNLTLRDGGDYPARDRAVKGRVVGALEGEAAAGGHPSSDCSGSEVDRTFFLLAALTAYAGEGRWNPTTFQLVDVYCAVLPADWSIASRTLSADDRTVRVDYGGPGGKRLTLIAGAIARVDEPPKATGQSFSVGAFRGRTGSLETIGGRHWYLVTGPSAALFLPDGSVGEVPIRWLVSGMGMSQAEFKSLLGTLIRVVS